MTEHCYLRTCERPVTTHLRGASFCDLHARVALDTGFDPEDTALMPPCPTDHEPHPAAAPHELNASPHELNASPHQRKRVSRETK